MIRRSAWIVLLAISPVWADVTLRYKTEFKMNPGLPPQMTQGVTQVLDTSGSRDSSYRLKGGKGYASTNGLISIMDFKSRQITVLDPAKKRFASLPAAGLADEFARAMPEIPPEARAAMASMKVASESKTTGRTAVIQGIQAEEREIVLTIEGPPGGNMPAGPMIRLVLQLWTARPGEAARNAALREFAASNLWSISTLNPAQSMQKMLGQMPGLGEGLAPLMKEMRSPDFVMLRSHMEMFMPAMAALMQRIPEGNNPFGANFDPNAAFMQMDQELVELSTAGVEDAVFQVPEGYEPAPVADIIRDAAAKGRVAVR